MPHNIVYFFFFTIFFFGCKKNKSTDKNKGQINKGQIIQEMAPVGIPNVGNTCYLAAVMQSVANHATLRNLFFNHKGACEKLAKAGVLLIEKLHQGQIITENEVKDLQKAIHAKKNEFTIGKQHCSQELLTFFFKALGSKDSELMEIQENNKISGHNFANIYSAKHINGHDIGDMIKDEFKTDNLIHSFKTTLLPVSLTRYKAGKKDTQDINVPFELTIPDTCFIIKSTASAVYTLKSVIIHHGSSFNSGHYTACVKKNNQWYDCNDKTITDISEDDVKKKIKKGSLFFYEKK